MAELTSYSDQNYALRKAVERAGKRLADEIYNWPADKTSRYYYNLTQGDQKVELILENPSDMEPVG